MAAGTANSKGWLIAAGIALVVLVALGLNRKLRPAPVAQGVTAAAGARPANAARDEGQRALPQARP